MKVEKTRKTLIILEILIILTLFTGAASASNPPTNVVATLSGTSMTVSWTAATGVTQYRVGLYNVTGTNNTLINYRYINTTSTIITVPLVSTCYTAHVRSWLPNRSTNSVVSNKVCVNITTQDITPPGSITGLANISYAQNYINWTWINPSDPDFSRVMIYIDGTFMANVSNVSSNYNATGFGSGTAHSIGTHTVDTSGNINLTWVNDTRTTAPDVVPTPPSPLTASLTSIALTVTANGGTKPYNYSWKEVPDISVYCSGTDTDTIKCSPTNQGPYNMTVTITDANNNVMIISNNVSSTNRSLPSSSGNNNTLNTLRFVTIGDVHIGGNNAPPSYTDGLANFTRAINYINNMTDVDFVVQLGDIVDNASVTNFVVANSTLRNFTKPYYVIEGNHDIGSPSGTNFRKYIGPTNRLIKDFKGYQLIFPGIDRGSNLNISAYDWIFNYSTADKSKPTIVFDHGPVKPNPNSKITDCVASWDGNGSIPYYGYACNMSSELSSFTNILGVYAGHVHTGTNRTINGTLYVTEDNIGGNGAASIYIGNTIIQDGNVTYSKVIY